MFDAALAAKVNALNNTRIYRITHADDIVPSLPFMKLGFAHTGTEIYYPNADFDIYRACPFGSFECIDSILHVGIAAHLYYMGFHISRNCPLL